MEPIQICLHCLGPARTKCFGPCPCKIDGKDIIEHAQTGKCPIGRFDFSPEELAKLNPPAKKGVGAHLTDVLRELDIADKEGCRCHEHAAEMDRSGVEWCKANRQTIIVWLEEEAVNRSWFERLKASASAASAGYFSFSALLDEAIRRASTKH